MKKEKLIIIGFFILYPLLSLLGNGGKIDADFFMNIIRLFPLGIFIVFIVSLLKYQKMAKKQITDANILQETQRKCPKCNAIIKEGNKFCTNCGNAIENIVESVVEQEPIVKSTDFDPIYLKSEQELLITIIDKEAQKAGLDLTNKDMPDVLIKRKTIFRIIFSLLLFIYISLIFIHFPLYTYIIGGALLIIFFAKTIKYNVRQYIEKEIKSRPDEKISNIIMNIKMQSNKDNLKVVRIASLVAAVVLPLIIFYKPVIIYEPMEDGYAVRYYAFGLTNFTSVTIPETHKGKPVLSLRGNAFSNMPFLKSVVLPDSIVEIRGQAFLNDRKLEEVQLPKNLKSLGGASFKNCTSLKSIEIPDTVEEMGGEIFYNATSLEKVKLSKKIPEIRGDSFEYCTSLKSIEIPDSVSRIGGHAFYGDTSLSEVTISPNSKLVEIGSSAFRRCTSLYSITIPQQTYVNERAFKESPTSINRYGVGLPTYY